LQASCGVTLEGSKAIFTTSVTHALGTVSYKDGVTGAAIPNPTVKTVTSGGSVTQKITVTDAFDGLTASASCTVTSDGKVTGTCAEGGTCVGTTTDATGTPAVIDKFMTYPSIVARGEQCKFTWATTGMKLCSFRVNGEEKSTEKNKIDLLVETYDGDNKNGILTCIGSSTTGETVTASTTCRVNPEVRQQ
jgi:hypothetical protein